MSQTLLKIKNLEISFPGEGGEISAVRGVDLTLKEGESLAIVGESGCGKTLTALSVMGLIPKPGRVSSGEIIYKGSDVARLGKEELRRLRGREVSMVFQEPMTSLNPVFTAGYQLAEAVNPDKKLTRSQVKTRSVEILKEVGIPEPEKRLKAYPHQLSGGLRQRVMIGTAIAAEPSLIIADEPTTALDVTVEAQIMELLGELREKKGISLLLITHDLGVVAHYASRVMVMYAGHVVEEASVKDLFADPLHPYTRGLMASLPKREEPLRPIRGMVPTLRNIPSGCPFRDRCDIAVERCADELPDLKEFQSGRKARCIRVGEDA